MTVTDTDVTAAWDRNAPLWTERVRAGADLYREAFNNPSFLAFVPDLQGLDVIDLGCGEGSNTRLFARKGARMTGVDLSPVMIGLAREQEKREPLGIEFHATSFGDLSVFAENRFDAAISTMALMDCADFAAAARATYRVVKPGGVFAFSVLHPCFVTPRLRWIRDESGREQALAVGGYFDRESSVERWRFNKDPEADKFPEFEVPRFPRRLETYVNGLIEAGFRIARLQEPQPTDAMVATYPWLARWQRHAAIFLYVAAQKPAASAARGER
jgi:2-polyprenyl-3-methyl-5-hydroxy-6-metoxy-1,4-benzoquinol methylase